MSSAVRFARDMGINRRDFFRILPTAIGESQHRIEGSEVHINPVGGSGSLKITLGEESERRLSTLMVLPRMQVDFEFHDTDSGAVQAFMDVFDFYYRRGGG
ncbi:MAG: hypothetical protein AAF420_08465 [Pseudomonadota bacterium]